MVKVTPVSYSNKIDFRKHPNHNNYSSKKKPAVSFKDVLDKEISSNSASKTLFKG